MTKEYNWTQKNTDFLHTPVPSEVLPVRAAVATVYVVTRTSSNYTEMLLVNPHPETWNNWQLPYGSVTFELDSGRNQDWSFASLTQVLTRLRWQNNTTNVESIRNQLNELLPNLEVDLDNEPLFANYSLKYSKTSNVWTAYKFEYQHIVVETDIIIAGSSTWLSLEPKIIQEVIDKHEYQQLKVAENIRLLLDDSHSLSVMCG